MKTRSAVLATGLATVLLLATATTALAKITVGSRAPDFGLKDAKGKTVKLSSLKGKVVLIDFWASWCKPCKKELPALDKLARKLAGKDVVFLAINIDTDKKNADAFIKSAKVTALTLLFDPQSNVAEQYDLPTMPTSFVVDAKGIVRFVHEGYKSGDEKTIEKEINSL